MGIAADELASDCSGISLTPEPNSTLKSSHKKDRKIRSPMAQLNGVLSRETRKKDDKADISI